MPMSPLPHTLKQVCFRPTASASLGPLADAADIYGMPCFRYHVLDCFQEGDFDYNFDDIDAANVGVTVAAVGLPNTYLSKPSFRGKTPQQLLDVISPTCQSWSGLPIPENYVVGGISRAGADTDGDGEADGALTGVISTQSVWRLFSATTFAKREKERNCAVAGRETCTNSFKSCAQQCVAEGGLCGQNCVGAQGSSCVTAAVMAQGATCVSDLISAQVSTCLQSASTPGEQMDCQIAAQKCGEFASDSTTFAANQNDCTAATLQSLGACSDDANLCGQFFSDSTANAQHQTKCTAATLTTGSTCVADATKCGGFLTTGDTSLASFCTADTLTCVGTCQSSGETCVNNCVGTAAVCKGTAVATSGCDLTVDDEDVAAAEVLLESWEQKFLEYLETVDADNFDTRMFAQRSRNDLVKEGGEGSAPLLILGYAAMCLFAIVALFQTNFLQSKVGLALSGLLLVCLSTVASYGCAAMFDIPLTPTNTIVAPFLALGLGVNDMFVIVYSFQYSEKKSLEQMLIDTVVTAGPSISLTSLCIFVAFACGTSVLLPAVHYFCLFSMIIVVLNYLVLLFGFVPLLYYTGLRIRSRKLDVLCCLPYTSPAPQGEEQAAPTDVEMKAAAGEQKSDNTADVESGSEKKSRGGEGDGEVSVFMSVGVQIDVDVWSN